MSMRRIIPLLTTIVAIGGCAGMGAGVPSPEPTATLRDAQGRAVGTAKFSEKGNGDLEIKVSVQGLPPGTHGIHIHAIGRCNAPEFTSAGPHLDPVGRSHGLSNPAGPHGGDMPNLVVGSNGKGSLSYENPRMGVGPLLDSDGSAIVIHAAADDQKTDPSGNSGARIACGVIETRGGLSGYGR